MTFHVSFSMFSHYISRNPPFGRHDWYTTGWKYLTDAMGFHKGKNVPSTYAIDTTRVRENERAATTAKQIGATLNRS
jgi:hypothetical protein